MYFKRTLRVYNNLSSESLALLDVLLELWQASLEQFLLLGRQRTNGVNLLNTVFLQRKQRR